LQIGSSAKRYEDTARQFIQLAIPTSNNIFQMRLVYLAQNLSVEIDGKLLKEFMGRNNSLLSFCMMRITQKTTCPTILLLLCVFAAGVKLSLYQAVA
jgi:hypothetical protein